MRPRTSLKRLLALSGDLGRGRCLLLSDRGRECMVAASCTMFLATSWAVDNARLRDSDEGKHIVCAVLWGRSLWKPGSRPLLPLPRLPDPLPGVPACSGYSGNQTAVCAVPVSPQQVSTEGLHHGALIVTRWLFSSAQCPRMCGIQTKEGNTGKHKCEGWEGLVSHGLSVYHSQVGNIPEAS